MTKQPYSDKSSSVPSEESIYRARTIMCDCKGISPDHYERNVLVIARALDKRFKEGVEFGKQLEGCCCGQCIE